ncbi:hypothetical protein K2173_023810 [Erythroxylum novogranatense]|uniref:glycerophosphodiester phosphodiesterase n=1 Tax=Erythroxylum novogranatense TaxID=1862640 RepID=A0AAV8TKT7_9ROSI|nr:hypothetical protein K2173_023810 [Erythroxylum novogranatense]
MNRRRESPAMCLWRALTSLVVVLLLLVLLQCTVAPVSAQRSNASSWLTLNGNKPSIIARGGFSGLLPHSSFAAYQLAQLVSDPDVIFYCDVQLTKDGAGICTSDLLLQNSTDISRIYPNKSSSYNVNGAITEGYFPVDFTLKDLSKVTLVQSIYSRSQLFDGYPIQTVEEVASLKPKGLWLNVQHDLFFSQHNFSMRSYVLTVSRTVVVNVISSPEVGFLRSIASRFNPRITKLIFRFLGPSDIEPSMNQTYTSLSKNLTFIKTFASGILVPKAYIWPVDGTLYLQPHTSIVQDAHKEGLEVYASEFYNDVPLSYNYSYDPITEYLNFVDNGDFSVDGVLSDFPITPSEAIDCFAHLGSNASENVKLLVISKNGASGDYPDCTDLAYNKAISDRADVIDCPVQMSKEGIPFCMSSINLINSTNVLRTNYSSLSTTVPQIQPGSGIFTFNLTWNQIQGLTPAISNPYSKYFLYRNPKFKDAGHFLTLSEFLDLAKNSSSLSGVLISIENAAYLIEQQLPIIDAVLDAVSKAGYGNQTAKRVMIQSSSSSVLMKIKEKSNYERVYKVDEDIRDAAHSAIEDIKTFATSVVVSKSSVFLEDQQYLTRLSDVVPKLQSAKLPVYVETLSNEFVSQPWDFFSDATVEINNHVQGAGVDGVITDFPYTSARYKWNQCSNLGNNTPNFMAPVQPGSLFQLMQPSAMPPVEPPNPVLTVSDVAESPLPDGVARTPPAGGTTSPAPTSNGPPRIAACIFLLNLAMLISALLLL